MYWRRFRLDGRDSVNCDTCAEVEIAPRSSSSCSTEACGYASSEAWNENDRRQAIVGVKDLSVISHISFLMYFSYIILGGGGSFENDKCEMTNDI